MTKRIREQAAELCSAMASGAALGHCFDQWGQSAYDEACRLWWSIWYPHVDHRALWAEAECRLRCG